MYGWRWLENHEAFVVEAELEYFLCALFCAWLISSVSIVKKSNRQDHFGNATDIGFAR